MPNYLITHAGEYGANLEIFRHTLVVSCDSTDQPAVADACRAAFESAWASTATIAAAFSQFVHYEQLSAAEILDLNLGTLRAASWVDFVGGMAGSGSGWPYQIAAAVSLTAGTRPNGQPMRGRFYLPTPHGQSSPESATGRIAPATVAKYVALIDAYFGALAAGVTPAGPLIPSVWSRALGVVQPVTGIRVGNVPDTIRTRRGNLPEVYTPGVYDGP